MDSTVELVKALLQFIFLFGLVLLLAWLTTRFAAGRLSGQSAGGSLRVLQHIAAGRDRSVMLLEVGGRVYLLGVTSQQITLLDAIDDPGTIDRILQGAAPAPSQAAQALSRSFADVLGRLTGRGSSLPSDTEPEQTESAEAARLREQIERLRRMQNK